ncbi:hypothetical protein ACRAWG_31220 [Methylobacterium sp. P31]
MPTAVRPIGRRNGKALRQLPLPARFLVPFHISGAWRVGLQDGKARGVRAGRGGGAAGRGRPVAPAHASTCCPGLEPQGPLYKATEAIVDAIDGLADVVWGAGGSSTGGTRRHPVLIYHRRGSEPSSSALSLELEEAPMHTPIPTPDLAAFLALMGLLAVIATLANA